MGGKGDGSLSNPYDVEAQKTTKRKESEESIPGKVVKAPPYAGPKVPPSPAPSWAPSSGKVTVEKSKDGKTMNICIPAAGFCAARGGNSSPAFLLAFACLWLMALLAIPFLVILSGMRPVLLFGIVPFVLFGLFLVWLSVRNACLEEKLELTKKAFKLEKNLFGWKTVVTGDCADIVAFDLKIQRQFQECAGFVIRETKPATWCYIIAGSREINFGHFSTSPEQQHVLKEMSLFLRVPMGTGTLAPSAFG